MSELTNILKNNTNIWAPDHRVDVEPTHEMARRPELKTLRGLTFDDVSILPERTNIRPDQVSLQGEILKGLRTALPVFAAAMESVWSVELTCSMAEFGAIAPISRELPREELIKAIDRIRSHKIDRQVYSESIDVNGRPPIIVSASPFDHGKLEFLLTLSDVDYILLDTVHPYNDAVIEAVAKFSLRAPFKLIVGNVATAEAAQEFCKYPIAALKVGLGPGSICTTREISGVGVPQLEAIQEVANVARRNHIPVIADGGIRSTGDIAKAIAAGANSVMMGRLFAGTHEAVGDITEINGKKFKHYAGSKYTSVEHDGQSGLPELDSFLESIEEQNHRVEGVSGYVPYSGPVKALLLQIKRSLGASLAFTGSATVSQFQTKARLIQVSPSAFHEGRAHSIAIITHQNQFFGR